MMRPVRVKAALSAQKQHQRYCFRSFAYLNVYYSHFCKTISELGKVKQNKANAMHTNSNVFETVN